MAKNMTLPCSVCGMILQIRADAEFIFCTSCGNRISIGTHSYNPGNDQEKTVFCVNCATNIDPNSSGMIFSCVKCTENVCNICSKILDNKHYCPNCYSTLPLPARKTTKKTSRTRSTKKSRSRKRSQSSTKTKDDPKSTKRSTSKSAKKKSGKNTSKNKSNKKRTNRSKVSKTSKDESQKKDKPKSKAGKLKTNK